MKKTKETRAGAAKSMPRINLSGVIYHEGADWLAHCLELDIVAEGKTPAEAFRNVIDLCEFQIDTALEEGDLQSIFRPAPPEMWKMFALASERPAAVRKLPKVVNRFEARELEFA